MKNIIIALFMILNAKPDFTIHKFSIQKLNSDEIIQLSDYKGKKILIVNVASKCGYTPQYEELQKLQDTYQEKLVVIGFPCNQFMNQEAGDEEEIASFCKKNYGVSFPITTKIDVKGKNQHPIYSFLTNQNENGQLNSAVSWNFNKYLLDENGKLIAHFGSGTTPLSKEITDLL